jgi:hypothetical protein
MKDILSSYYHGILFKGVIVISINKSHHLTKETHYRGFPIQLGKDGGLSVIEILDSIITLLKWSLSRHNKVMVLRYDVFLAGHQIAKPKLFNEVIRRVRTKYSPNSKIFYVTERGKNPYNEGIHYHAVITVPLQDGAIITRVGRDIREVSNLYLRKHLHLGDDYLFPSDEEIILRGESQNPIDIPYTAYRGYFQLDRRHLTPTESEKQRISIKNAVDNGAGYRYLNASNIRKRSYNKSKVLGGVLVECIYSLSYLAKLKTKESLPKGERAYSNPRYEKGENKAGATRLREIEKHSTEVDKYFSQWDNKQAID